MDPLADDLDRVVGQTRGLWDPIRDQAVFITGGSGFFGRWLLESFLRANEALHLNARLVVLTRNPEAVRARARHLAEHPALTWITGDIRTLDLGSVRSQLGAAMPCGFPFMIHAATESDARRNLADPLGMIETITCGTRHALELARQAGVRRLLFTSSGAVYGPQPPGLTHIPEDYAGAPDCLELGLAYGSAKRLAETLCVGYARQFGIEPVIARCFAFVGPYLPLEAHFAIGNFIRDAMRGGPVRVSGDGSPFRSYLYAADLAAWLWTLLFRGVPCRPYNVGSDQDLDIAGVARAVAAQVDPACAVDIARPRDPSCPAQRYVPDVSRIKGELGVRETFDLTTAIRRTISWHRARPRD